MLANDGRNPRGYRCEKNKHRENPGIESASGSLRAAGLKCIRSRNRVCLHLQSGNEGSSNYRGIQPIVTRFPPEDCVRLSGAGRMRKERKKTVGRGQREGKGEKKKTILHDGKRGAKEARFRRLPATETPRNRRRQGGEGERDREKRKRNKRKARREMQIKRLLSLEHKLSPCVTIFCTKQEICNSFYGFSTNLCVIRDKKRYMHNS